MSAFLLLYLFTLLDLRWSAPWLPVLPLALLLPLTLSLPGPVVLLAAFLSGVLRDGLFPQVPWTSPPLFLLAAWLGLKAQEYLNLSLWAPRFLLVFLLTALVTSAFLFLRAEGGIWSRTLVTGLAAAILSLLRKP